MQWNSIRFAVVIATSLASAGAQTAHVYYHDPATPASAITNQVMRNSACHPPVPQAPVNPGYAMPIVLGAAAAPLGGHAIDQISDVEYISDGPTIQIDAHPLYAPGVGPCPPLRTQCVSGVYVYPHPSGFGNITGMAYRQPAGALCPGILWVTDGTLIMGLPACPGLGTFGPPIVPPFLAPPSPAGAPLTGLEAHSGAIGLIVACDQAGYTYIIPDPTVGCTSLPIFPVRMKGPPAPLPPLPPPPFYNNIIGNVFDRGTYEIFVTDGTTIWCSWGVPGTITIAPAPGLGFVPRGASFSAEPIALPACSGNYSSLVFETTKPIVAGESITLSVTTPASCVGKTAMLAFGPCYQPYVYDCSSCGWLLDLYLMQPFYTTVVAHGAGGKACLSGTVGSMTGLVLFAQWAVIDSTCGAGLRFSDMMHGRISAP
jgi:hypothetical protein